MPQIKCVTPFIPFACVLMHMLRNLSHISATHPIRFVHIPFRYVQEGSNSANPGSLRQQRETSVMLSGGPREPPSSARNLKATQVIISHRNYWRHWDVPQSPL